MVLLPYQKMRILKNMGILVMGLDLIEEEVPGGGFGQNVIIFGVDMSSSIHIDNKGKDILILGVGPTQGLENTLTPEKNVFY